MAKLEIAGLGIAQIAELIKLGDINALEVTQACIARAHKINRDLNCFVRIEAGAALEAAREADRQRRTGAPPGPLHGIPLAHKDIFYRRGKALGAGTPVLQDFKPDFTATPLKRLANAGAITIGVLQTAEFALSPTGLNTHFPLVRNPWHRERVPGGSSSGSAVAVSAGVIPGSLGTDTGGSIRHPAAMCGIIGLKPTQGRVSRHGLFPLAQSLDCPGILARSARDAALLLGVVAGPDANDSSCSNRAAPDYTQQMNGDLRGIRIGIPTGLSGAYYYEDIKADIAARVHESLEVLKARGARCMPVDVIDMHQVNKLGRTIFSFEAARVHSRWLKQQPEDYSGQVRARVEAGFQVKESEYRQALSRRSEWLVSFLDTSLAQADILHIPCVPVATPAIEDELNATLEQSLKMIDRITHCTRGINYLTLPAISVPCGFIDPGLPVAFQLVSRPFEEAVLLKAADAYQRDAQWRQRPRQF
jgi:aspartyl-tRNA(Asn)/glutamyl-tRNA(Gln) amidotransferase subunit A